MPDPITDDTQDNAVTAHWYDDLAGDNEERQTQLSQFETFDDFMSDYSAAKNADWRDGIAGDDDKFKSTLERYATPSDFGNAHREMNQKLRAGQMLPALADDATEDDIKSFREQNSIPLEADGYLESLPDGLVVGENDKDLVMDFMGALHEVNADPKIAHKAIEWYNKLEESQQEAEAELDAEHARQTTDALRDPEEGWGKDYRTNMNLIKSALSSFMGDEASEQLLNGRYQDGRGFFNDANVLKGFAAMARQVNDVAPLIDNDPDQLQSLHDEIKSIESKMGTKEYKEDEAMQARLRDLYDLRLRTEQAA